MKLIDISTPKFPNTFAMVDDEDFPSLNKFKWFCHEREGIKYAERNASVAERRCGSKSRLLMHHSILGAIDLTDHRNGNGLDNQKENLRACTHKQNMANRKHWKNKTLPKGVSWDKSKNRYVARVQGCRAGVFRTIPEAESAYIAAAKAAFGEFYRETQPQEKN